MKLPEVSILVPVYNVAQYLPQCLESIVNQTLKNIEIILVNDCSPFPEDDRICREYAEKDNRIKYFIHSENKGVGGARNTAIEKASATYIGWIDSDDWAELDMFEKLYENIKENGSDISQCYFTEHLGNEQKLRKLKTFRKQKDVLNSLNVLLWNKLFKKELFTENKIYFPEHISIDDVATMPRLFYFVNHVSLVKESLYHYRVMRKGGVTDNYERVFKEYSKVYSDIKNFLEKSEWWNRDKIYFEKRVVRSLIHEVSRLYRDKNVNLAEKHRILNEQMSKSLFILSVPQKANNEGIRQLLFRLRWYKLNLDIKITLNNALNFGQ